jgi:hypothetical protein
VCKYVTVMNELKLCIGCFCYYFIALSIYFLLYCLPALSAYYCDYTMIIGCTWWRSWLRHCATSWKVTGLILIVSLEFFIDIILPAAL